MTLIPNLGAAPVALLLKATLVLLLAGLVAIGLRQSSAGRRHLVWSAAVVALLVVPFLSLTPALQWDLAVLPAPDAPPAAEPATSGAAVTQNDAATQSPAVAAPVASNPAPAGSISDASKASGWWARSSWAERLIVLWLAGAALVLARLLIGCWLVRRMVRSAERLDTPEWQRPLMDMADRLEVPELPDLRLNRRLPMPFAFGLFRPAIVLPGEAEGWSAERRRAVLCHELAHLRRRDLAINLLSQLTLALYWFHPLMWVALRRLRVESERACDDLVLNTGTRPSEYADHLLQILRAVPRLPMPAAVLPFAQRGEFEGRVLAILEPAARREPAGVRGAAAVYALGLLLVLPLATLRPVARAADPAAEQWGTELVAPTGDTDGRVSHSTVVPRPAAAEPRRATRPAPSPDPKPAPSPSPGQAAILTLTDSSTAQDSSVIIRSLINALSDSSAEVRKSAAYSLGRLRATDAVTALQRLVERDPSVRVREMSVWALGNMRAQAAAPALSAAITRDSSADVRGTALWAAGQLDRSELLPALGTALRDPVPENRARAAWAIGTIRPERAPAALHAAAGDSVATVRHRVAWALGQIRDSASLPTLLKLVEDHDSSVREAAFWALGNQEPNDATAAAMLKALQASDPAIRAQAAQALSGSRGRPWPWPWPWPR